MTREEALQIYYLSKEVEALQARLNEMRSRGLKSPKLDGMPRAPGGVGDPVATQAVREADLEKKIMKLLKRIQRKRREIFEYIENVDDSLLRMIIIFRCVDLCTWDEVASNIGGPVTPDSARMAFNRHFREAEAEKK